MPIGVCVNLSFFLDKMSVVLFLKREERVVGTVLFNDSSVKCVDAFRIALTEEPKLLIKQKHG